MHVLLVIAGLALLFLGGDALVRGAVALAFRLGVPVLVVGLTVVAFGTSAPELLVSVDAALTGVPGIAVGNVVGSNIANVLLVLGLPAVVTVVRPAGGDSHLSYLQMLAASLALIVLMALGPLDAWDAAVLLGLFALVLADAFRAARDGRAEIGAVGVSAGVPRWRLALLLGAGLVGLPLGAHLLIEGAVGIAEALGVSEEAIGLTLVAVGTSLPEVAASLAAALRRETDVVLGNVIGSNLFNILLILGVTSLFGPIAVAPHFLTRDLWVMLAAALVLGPFLFLPRPIGRLAGALFILAYAAYIVVLFMEGGSAA